jgi:Holliday junction resolvase RusA-like endonuclease
VTPITFTVPGRPLPSGSKSTVPITRDGHTIGRRIVESGNRQAKAAWRADIQHHATHAMHNQPPLTGPVELTATFYLRRPQSHYGQGRNRHRPRPAAPAYPIVAPDVLKLARGLEDALQRIVYVNDAQIVVEHLAKVYVDDLERTEVAVWPAAAITPAPHDTHGALTP